MPLSGNEEGVVTHSWHSSDYISGVPIKKRRFLLVQPTSPQPETPSSPELEVQEQQFIGQSLSSSNAGSHPEISGFAGKSTCSLQEKGEEKSNGSNGNLVKNRVGYSGLGCPDQTVFVSQVDSKCKFFPENTELQLASYGNHVPGVEETVTSEVELSLSRPSDKSESRSPGNSDLLLARKVSLHMPSACETSGGASRDQEKLDPHKWNLGLPKVQSGSNSNDGKLELKDNPSANRSHWDLNTTMETWEASKKDAAVALRNGVDLPGKHDINHEIGSTGMSVSKSEGALVGLGKNIINKNDQCPLSRSIDQQNRSDDLLGLGLYPSVSLASLRGEVFGVPREVDTGRVTLLGKLVPTSQLVDQRTIKSQGSDEGRRLDSVAEAGCAREVDSRSVVLPEKLASASKLVDHRIVKSEPSDEGNRLESVAKVDCPKMSDIVKSEPLQGNREEPHKLSNTGHMKSEDQRAVKSKVQGSSEENFKRVEKISEQAGGLHKPFQGCSEKPNNSAHMIPVVQMAVKFEPGQESTEDVDENLKRVEQISEQAGVSHEPFQGCLEKPNSTCHMTSIVQRAVKCEPVQESSKDSIKTQGKVSAQAGIRTRSVETPTTSAGPTHNSEISATRKVSHTLELSPTGLSGIGNVSDHSSLSPVKRMPVCRQGGEASKIIGFIVSDADTLSVNPDRKEPKFAADLPHLHSKECLHVAIADQSKINQMQKLDMSSVHSGEVSKSGKKVNGSAQEDPSNETEKKPDCNHAIGNGKGTEETPNLKQDMENQDGEVRDPMHNTPADGFCAEREATYNEDKRIYLSNLSGEPTIVNIQDSDTKMEEKEIADFFGLHEKTALDKMDDQGHKNVARVEENPLVALQSSELEKKSIQDVNPLNHTQRDIEKVDPAILASDGVTSTSKVVTTNDDKDEASVSHGKDETVNLPADVSRTSSFAASCLVSPNTEQCVSSETAKDINSKVNQSRIINLPRATNVSLSCTTKSVAEKVLASQSQERRFNNEVLRGAKLQTRGSREGRYLDSKFEGTRNRNQPFGSSRSEFRFARGRSDCKSRNIHRRWDNDHEFPTEQCNGGTSFRFSKSSTAASRGGRTLGWGRGGRKFTDDESPNFCRRASRRLSPGVGVGGPVLRGGQLVCRGPGDISPASFTEEDPDLIGFRHEEKFMRGLPDEVMDTGFSHPQSQYERLEDSFVRGSRSFSALRRRLPLHIPEVHSQSPPQLRPRSPGPWTSPRRRSPNGFVRCPEMERMGSPRTYRLERTRSPHQHPSFPEEMVRRHDSTPYMSQRRNEMRGIGSSRDLDHPSGRTLSRSMRRFEMVDPRERSESDDLFAEGIHSGRFHDIVGEVGNDGRRKSNERHIPVREAICPQYNGSDVVNFRNHVEDCPRPYRFHPEDAEFHEREISRGREFKRENLRERGNIRRAGGLRGSGIHRRMENRTDNAPRTRGIEKQEENYWRNEQSWGDANYDDASHMKRRRY